LESCPCQSPRPQSTIPPRRFAILALPPLAQCLYTEVSEPSVSRLPDQRQVKTFTLSHPSGISATVSELGATLRTLSVPGRDGEMQNILVGFKTPEEWLSNSLYSGTTVGRYANRIAGAKFSLNGKEYQLATNSGPNHLHGGKTGFDKLVWKTEAAADSSVRFTLISPDGDEGYPGKLSVTVEYKLDADSLTWTATATTDKATPVNLTSHAYFNLTGEPSNSVLSHTLQINATEYLPVDGANIPTGEFAPVASTSFDFNKPASIAANLAMTESGFDHTFVLNSPQELRPAVSLHDPGSGRTLELSTNQPGVQLYLSSPFGNEHSAICLEPQKYPDSPNKPDFPCCILNPGETYSHTIVLRFPRAE
jgi:aldose 1-epimerase